MNYAVAELLFNAVGATAVVPLCLQTKWLKYILQAFEFAVVGFTTIFVEAFQFSLLV